MSVGGPRLAHGIGVALLVIATIGTARAADYYVEGANPACSNSGVGSEAQPYCTISAAVAAHPGPGNRILVKPGLYREQVTIPSSGTSANRFTLQALGGTVVVDGSDDFSSPELWTDHTDEVYVAAGVTWNPLQVFMDGTRLKPSTEDPDALPEGSFTWVSGEGLYVHAGGDNPGDHALLVGRRNHGFNASGKSWLVIDGFTVLRTESRGIFLSGACTDIVVSRDTVGFTNSYGIHANNGARILIEECRSSDNNLHGIGLTAGATACTLRANECMRNADPSVRRANGIHLYMAPGNTLERNRVYDNQDSGFHFGDLSDNCVAFNNRSWNNGDHGYDHLSASGTVHAHDVSYGNYKDGFSIEGNALNTRLHDCIAVDNGLTSGRYDLYVDGPSMSGFVSDYNLFWNSTTQKPIRIGLVSYTTVAAYSAATGQDAHSLQGDPRFVDAPAGDFHLLAGSPAIDAGASGVPAWPALDADGMARVDDPATVNSGSGPVTFPDRGAFEFLTDQAPVVTVPPEATLSEYDSVTIVVTARDPDGDPIDSLTVAGLPPGASFVADPGDTSGTFRWTPTTGQAGGYTVRFQASGAFTGLDSTLITVTAATLGVGPDPSGGPALRPRIVPHPVRGAARLRFATARPGPVRVELFDLGGRVVRTLMDVAMARAGEHEIGIDADAPGLSPGLYFYRIRTPDGDHRGRFALLQ